MRQARTATSRQVLSTTFAPFGFPTDTTQQRRPPGHLDKCRNIQETQGPRAQRNDEAPELPLAPGNSRRAPIGRRSKWNARLVDATNRRSGGSSKRPSCGVRRFRTSNPPLPCRGIPQEWDQPRNPLLAWGLTKARHNGEKTVANGRINCLNCDVYLFVSAKVVIE
jgi:hypothetical protein